MTDAAKPRRKPSSLSPTKRALAELRKRGWPAAIVEHWNQWARIRQDLFGIFDLVALRPEEVRRFDGDGGGTIVDAEAAILAIQVCMMGDRAKRRDKILASPYLKPWIDCGGAVELWSYAKHGKAGQRKLWDLTVERIDAAFLAEHARVQAGRERQ